jgi:hypothetical protein
MIDDIDVILASSVAFKDGIYLRNGLGDSIHWNGRNQRIRVFGDRGPNS